MTMLFVGACLIIAWQFVVLVRQDMRIADLETDLRGIDSRRKFVDPVHFYSNPWEPSQWYFWGETWADRIGPFATEEEARKALESYARNL